MIDLKNVKIAVDFDGTIVEHAYPEIGKEMLFAFMTLRELEKAGALLILWTFRAGKELDEAVEYCRENGIEFYAVNSNYPEEVFDGTISRKINADIFIDDRNVGGFPGWGEIWHMLFSYEPDPERDRKAPVSSKRQFHETIIFLNKDQMKSDLKKALFISLALFSILWALSCSGKNGVKKRGIRSTGTSCGRESTGRYFQNGFATRE